MRILLRVMALFLLLYAGLSVLRGLMNAFIPNRQVKPRASGHLIKDPVCGTYIPQEKAIAGGNQFFCSEECRRKFLA